MQRYVLRINSEFALNSALVAYADRLTIDNAYRLNRNETTSYSIPAALYQNIMHWYRLALSTMSFHLGRPRELSWSTSTHLHIWSCPASKKQRPLLRPCDKRKTHYLNHTNVQKSIRFSVPLIVLPLTVPSTLLFNRFVFARKWKVTVNPG